MADFARYLPLSQRRDGDESGVTTDRRNDLAAVVGEAARVLGESAADPGRRDDETVRFLAEAGLATGPTDLAALADALRTGPRRRIRELSRAVRAVLRLGADLGCTVELPPLVSGAVALYAAGSAPYDRRAVIRGRLVRATDEDWAFGQGTVLEAPGRDILTFLLGLSDRAPGTPAR